MKYLLHAGFYKCGSTLTAAILDAHPNIMCPMGLEPAIRNGVSGPDVLERIKEQYAIQSNWEHDWYKYDIPGQLVKGDVKIYSNKSAMDNSMAAVENWFTIEDFIRSVGMPVLCLVSCRNFVDMVNGVWAWKGNRRNNRNISILISEIERACAGLEFLVARLPSKLLQLENLIANPEAELTAICNFLEIENNEEWIRNCKKILFDKPRSRSKEKGWIPTWTKSDIRRAQELQERVDQMFSQKYW